MDVTFVIIVIILVIAILVFRQRTFVPTASRSEAPNIVSVEPFNNLPARIALYDRPYECPYDYVRIYEDREHNNKFVVESKLKGQPRDLDNVFESIDDFRDSWNHLAHLFPNLNICPDPYQNYLDNVQQFYYTRRYQPYISYTTTPLYQTGDQVPLSRNQTGGGTDTSMDSVSQSENTMSSANETPRLTLSSINAPPEVTVRQLTRTVNNPSQLGTDRYMLPNNPITLSNTQIDTSVIPASDLVPITNSDANIQQLKNQLIDDNFERQRAFQKQVFQLRGEIDQLRLETEWLRQQLVDAKQHFTDVDQANEDKHQQIVQANKLNRELSKKIADLQQKNTDIENLYLQADSQRNTMEVRLRALRNTVEEEIHNQGYTYIPPTHWTMNQWRPPECLSEKRNTTCPIATTSRDYATVFGETQVRLTPPIPWREVSVDPIDHLKFIEK